MKKRVLITGASRGIGRASALEFSKAGYDLVLNSLNNEQLLNEVRDEILAEGVDCVCYTGDMGTEEGVSHLFKTLSSRDIQIDILINNAGISHFGLLQDMSLSEWNRIISTNLTSAFLLSKYSIPNMIHNHWGKIINISSVWGSVGASYEVAYSASKGGLNAFTQALSKELAPSNIQVNAVACGIIDTDMNEHLGEEDRRFILEAIPAGRMGHPSEVAHMILKIAESPEYLTGQIINLAGGWH